ncbi:hypothetical protein SteCoe_10405 [Stentor coeruleus]|uniref:Uncharacterized protein n=1 Tax=Stentor coeruleus TaxID=5963 RepID=A0A1R2CFP1_9CILI|nr:hypothetical protein SteCoe_10405 [Stentor coeruleus]
MDWKKLGVFMNLSRFDVWEHIFAYLDVKTVMDGISKSCRSFKVLSLMHISHIKSICILPLNIDSKASYFNLIELLKCEKTFLLKIRNNLKNTDFMDLYYTNKSIVRLKFTSENGIFTPLLPLLKIISNFNHFTLSGNSSLPVVSEDLINEILKVVYEKKIVFFKISKVALNNKAFKRIAQYIKSKLPKFIIIDIACFSNKAVAFQNYLSTIWKNQWLLAIDYKLNGKVVLTYKREFLA